MGDALRDVDPVARELAERGVARWLAPDAVGLRQIPATVTIAVVIVIVDASVTPARPTLLVAAAMLVVLAQVVGLVGRWDRWPPPSRAALPLAQLAAIALLDVGAGLPQANFDVLLFLPMGTLALRPERWGRVLALCGCAAVLLVPVVVDVGRQRPLLHALVTFVIVAPVVLGAQGIVQAARRQARELQQARDALALRARQLGASRDTLRSVMDAATEQAIVATDESGVVLTASAGAARIFDVPLDELEGRDVTLLLGVHAEPDERPARLRHLVGRAAEGGTHVGEWHTTTADGSTRPVEAVVTARPRPDRGAAAGRPAGYLVVATDISSRYEEERQQDEFIGLVTHELRTPLASILGYLELVRMDGRGVSDEQARYLDVVERNANRLRSLVDDLLASAELVAGAPVAVAEVDVVDVVRGVVASQQPMADAAGVTLLVTGDRDVALSSDVQRLTQVVDNLLSNAVKYSLSGGTVVVDVVGHRRADNTRSARVSVSDEGTGIAPDELARITERFYRTRDTRRRRVRGVGLGLSLVQAFVDAHGGTLTIDSRPGQGTRVEVELPDLPGERERDEADPTGP